MMKHIRSWFAGSFRNRTFAMMFLATLLPLLLCDFVMIGLFVQRSQRNTKEDAAQQIAAVRGRLEDADWELTDISETLTESTVVRSTLRRHGTDLAVVYNFLFQATAGARNYADFFLLDEEGQLLYTAYGMEGTAQLPTWWGVLKAASLTEETAWQTANGPELIGARAVRTRDGDILGYLVIRLQQDGFSRLLYGTLGANSNLFLLDETWQVFYSTRPVSLNETIAPVREAYLDGEPLSAAGSAYSYTAEKWQGFTILLQQPRMYTTAVMNTMVQMTVIMAALSLVLSGILSWRLSGAITGPVRILNDAMKKAQKGDYTVQVREGKRTDEIGQLTRSFNHMIREYRENLHRSVERQKALNETQIRLLQAQLNPHFLYNTLDSVKWLAITRKVPEIAEIATNLAVLLRAGISDERMITLEEELDLVEKYIAIQEVRFGDRFTCEIDVGEEFQHCIIPKLVLQPVVENAIVHGVGDQDDGYIKVWAEKEGSSLALYVADNGHGMPEEVLRRLNLGNGKIREGHLGLYNVGTIIRLYYGKEYGLSAWSEQGKGSRIKLLLPMQVKVIQAEPKEHGLASEEDKSKGGIEGTQKSKEKQEKEGEGNAQGTDC